MGPLGVAQPLLIQKDVPSNRCSECTACLRQSTGRRSIDPVGKGA